MAKGSRKELTSSDPVVRFQTLFAGNGRSSGRYDPKRDRAFTEPEGLNRGDIEGHLNGVMGVGAVPILDDDTCLWAAIDMDNHGSDEDLPINKVDEIIRTEKLPLIACRSKSGGIHAYLFLADPQPAARIRAMMMRWATTLGYGGSEVFPKQGRLTDGKDGKKTLGNWINFPYFEAKKTMRYAVREGKILHLDEFLTLAERSRQTESDLRSLSLSDHPDAPPCIQKLYQHGVAQGHRNEALYNIVIYLKKKDPPGMEFNALDANGSVFSRPLARVEAMRTIGSASRGEMQYRCNEEPIRSLCDRDACLKRKFGITPADADRLATTESLPTFTDLCKYLTEPVRWEFKIDGVRIGNIGTPQLLDWRAMREIIADRLTKVVPMIKNQEWERVLGPLMKEARIIETPDDASISGIIRDRLREFASKTDLFNPGKDTHDRKALLRGLPVVQVIGGDRCVVFRGQDFVNYLKRTKSEELKGVNLWFAVKDIGTFANRMRIPGAPKGEDNINVWALPIKEVLMTLETGAESPEFKADL